MAKTIGTPSVSGPSQPSKAAPSVEYSESKLGKMKTVTDGDTTVQSNWSNNQRENYVAQTGEWPPCINTSCKSYGRPHPNCLCYPGHPEEEGSYAKGGQVCSGMHQDKCEHFADGGQVAENNIIQGDPTSALDHIAVHHGLLGLLSKTGHSKSPEPHKHLEDFVNHAKKGMKAVKSHTENLLGPTKSHSMDIDKSSIQGLKDHLLSIQENPQQLLDVGGSLGSILPHHGVQLAAKAGTAVDYLNGMKPKQSQPNPLDTLEPADKIAMGHYDRQLTIAQHPMMILDHLKDGTLRADDITTLHTLYPALSKSLSEKAFEQVVQAKQKGIEIPYKQKQGLSLLLGQPMDSTMTPQSMQAIIASQGPQQMQQKSQPAPKSKKASGVEIKQMNKVNGMDFTPLQSRQADKRD